MVCSCPQNDCLTRCTLFSESVNGWQMVRCGQWMAWLTAVRLPARISRDPVRRGLKAIDDTTRASQSVTFLQSKSTSFTYLLTWSVGIDFIIPSLPFFFRRKWYEVATKAAARWCTVYGFNSWNELNRGPNYLWTEHRRPSCTLTGRKKLWYSTSESSQLTFRNPEWVAQMDFYSRHGSVALLIFWQFHHGKMATFIH